MHVKALNKHENDILKTDIRLVFTFFSIYHKISLQSTFTEYFFVFNSPCL